MMRPYVQPLSTPCSRLARLPVLNPGNGWKTSWCACLPILATSECYFRATGRKSQRLAASSIQLSESGSDLPELRKSCCHLHMTPCHLYVLRRRLTYARDTCQSPPRHARPRPGISSPEGPRPGPSGHLGARWRHVWVRFRAAGRPIGPLAPRFPSKPCPWKDHP